MHNLCNIPIHSINLCIIYATYRSTSSKKILRLNRPLKWSGVVMVQYYDKTSLRVVRVDRRWSFNGCFENLVFWSFVHLRGQ